jgi:hypothetical protein
MPRRVHNEVLMCCNYRKCPRVEVFDDGSISLSDDDTEAGSVGTIKLRPEAAERLVALIAEHAKK